MNKFNIENVICFRAGNVYACFVGKIMCKYNLKKYIAVEMYRKMIGIDWFYRMQKNSDESITIQEVPENLQEYILSPFFEIDVLRQYPEIIWL
jgi:hypothetical protein